MNKEELIRHLVAIDFNFDDYIVVGIGSANVFLDSLGCCVGSLVKELNNEAIVYGTCIKPYHALNMQEQYNEIKEIHANKKILAIDACIGTNNKIGTILFKNEPIKPGEGVNKRLPAIGDYSIKCVTMTYKDYKNDMLINRIVLEHPESDKYINNLYDNAELIASAIVEADIYYKKTYKSIPYDNSNNLNKFIKSIKEMVVCSLERIKMIK
jgi:putative sporulation protein YyaC